MQTLILDTNTLLDKPLFFLEYGIQPFCNVILLGTVLSELDHLKSREDYSGYCAREASRIIYQITNQSRHDREGWLITDNCRLILDEKTERMLPSENHYESTDDRILACVEIYLNNRNKADDSIWLATSDRNMIIRANSRNIPVLNPTQWVPVESNHYVLSLAHQSIRWAQDGLNSQRLPINLEELGTGWVEVWPYWGFPNGNVNSIHFRLFEENNNGVNDLEHTSQVLIQGADKMRYADQMKGIPFQFVLAHPNSQYSIYHKGWKIELSVGECGVLNPAKETEQDRFLAGQIAANQVRLSTIGTIGSVAALGTLVGSALFTRNSIDNSAHVFTALSLEIKVTRATETEMELLKQPEFKKKLKNTGLPQPNSSLRWWIIAFIAIGIVCIPPTLCIGSFLLSTFISTLHN